MSPEHRPVYLDTCAVIAAVRAGCWKPLAGRFKLHTVEEVFAELQRGDARDSKYVKVDKDSFTKQVTIHTATEVHRVAAALKSGKINSIDAGERDLLAFCAAQPDALIITTGDQAAVMAACALGLGDRLVSLEELANMAGVKPDLPRHFTKQWLSKLRTDFITEETAQ